ncbi:unnamed protein product [Amaranthus hypochondriacus]
MPSERLERESVGFRDAHRFQRGSFSKFEYNGNKAKRSFRPRCRRVQRPSPWLGHQRIPHPRWWSGHRVLPFVRLGQALTPTFTLFIDGIHSGVSPKYLRDIFCEFGQIRDAFISKKRRANREDAFGFIRFSSRLEAEEAIKYLDGVYIMGRRLKVSVARYDKGGARFRNVHDVITVNQKARKKKALRSSFRDSRKFSEFLTGSKILVMAADMSKNAAEGEKVDEAPVQVVESPVMAETNCSSANLERESTSTTDTPMTMVDTPLAPIEEVCISVSNEDDGTVERLNGYVTNSMGTPSAILKKNHPIVPVKVKVKVRKLLNPMETARYLGFYDPITA